MEKKLLFVLTVVVVVPFVGYTQCNSTNNLLKGLNAAFAYPTNVGAENAFDDGTNAQSTAWTVSASPSTFVAIGVNLGTQHKFCSVHLKFDPTNYPSSFLINGSDNWAAFKNMAVVGNNTSSELDVVLDDVGLVTILQLIIYDGPTHTYSLLDFRAYESSSNTAPTVSFTSPAATGTYYVGQAMPLTVDAIDINGGSVSKVDYYLDNATTPLVTSTTSPFSASWSSPTLGAHTISAVATDNQNLASSPATVTINVAAAPSYIKNWTLTGNNLANSNTGTVFIGTPPATPASIPDAKLLVYGNIYGQKLTIRGSWADFVFNKGYKLRPLSELKEYVARHKHLPDVPSAQDVEHQGINVGANQAILLQKIEELTLYLLKQDEEIKKLKRRISTYANRVGSQKKKTSSAKNVSN